MKQFLTTDVGGYTFNAASKTVTFTGGFTPTLKQILAITNTTKNVMIYNPADSTKGGTLSGSVLTLAYNTTSHSNTDQLAIAVDTLGPTIHPAGFQRVTDEPRQVFYDPFDTALDTTNLWTTPTVGNSAVLASVTTGIMSMGTGTTASGWSKLYSIPSFKPTVPAWIGYSFAIVLPDGAAPTANAYRFWGMGTPAGTPTTAAPMTDAVGFELTTAGKLVAVVYAGGVRSQIADLSSSGNNTQPLDANGHRYIVYVRTDKVYWYIDNLKTQVAESSFNSPQIQTLPISLVAVGGSTPPASNTQIQCWGLAVWDTGKNATQIADGSYPFRKATVSSVGALKVDNSGVTQPISGTVTANAGTNLNTSALALDATLTGNNQRSRITDGTNIAAVKAASTAAVAADPSVVVAISPNNSVAVTGNQTATSTVSWTSATALNTALNISILNLNTVSVGIVATTTITGGVITFEISPDNVNWFPIQANRISSYNVETSYALVANTSQAWSTSVDGFTNFRVRLSTVISGTGTITVFVAGQTFAIEPIVSVGQATASNLQMTVGTALPAGTNKIGTFDIATAPATAKFTQGANFIPAQDAKDSGRSIVIASAKAIAGAASETVIATWAVSRDFAAQATSVTSLPNTVVTTGKRFRVQQMILSWVSTTTTANTTQIQFRVNTAGAGALASNLIFSIPRIGWSAATFIANQSQTQTIDFPDGLEFPAAAGIAVTHTEAAANGTLDVMIVGYEY